MKLCALQRNTGGTAPGAGAGSGDQTAEIGLATRARGPINHSVQRVYIRKGARGGGGDDEKHVDEAAIQTSQKADTCHSVGQSGGGGALDKRVQARSKALQKDAGFLLTQGDFLSASRNCRDHVTQGIGG